MSPPAHRKEVWGSAASSPKGVWGEAPAALTFSLFVASKNLTLNAEIDLAVYGIATIYQCMLWLDTTYTRIKKLHTWMRACNLQH